MDEFKINCLLVSNGGKKLYVVKNKDDLLVGSNAPYCYNHLVTVVSFNNLSIVINNNYVKNFNKNPSKQLIKLSDNLVCVYSDRINNDDFVIFTVVIFCNGIVIEEFMCNELDNRFDNIEKHMIEKVNLYNTSLSKIPGKVYKFSYSITCNFTIEKPRENDFNRMNVIKFQLQRMILNKEDDIVSDKLLKYNRAQMKNVEDYYRENKGFYDTIRYDRVADIFYSSYF